MKAGHVPIIWLLTAASLGWLLFVALTPYVSAVEPRIALLSRTTVCLAPCTLTFKVTVSPNAENRSVRVAVISDEDAAAVRVSAWQIDGERGPKTTWLTWRLDGGEYTIQGIVRGADDRTLGIAEQRMRVIGMSERSDGWPGTRGLLREKAIRAVGLTCPGRYVTLSTETMR